MLPQFKGFFSSWAVKSGPEPSNPHGPERSTSQLHLQAFNPDRSGCKAEPEFCLFPKLPTELRLVVWKYALERHRIIEVELGGGLEQWANYRRGIDCSSTIGRSYVYINGYQLMS